MSSLKKRKETDPLKTMGIEKKKRKTSDRPRSRPLEVVPIPVPAGSDHPPPPHGHGLLPVHEFTVLLDFYFRWGS